MQEPHRTGGNRDCPQRHTQNPIHTRTKGGVLVAKSCPTLTTPWTVACRLLCPWDIPGKNTAVGCDFLLQRIFPTRGSNPGLPHCKQTLYRLSHQKSLDSILKSRDITLLTNIHIVKAMVFPVIMYGCESWTIKKTDRQRTDAFKLRCWRRVSRVPWTARRSNQSILKEINLKYSLEGVMLNSLAV